MEKILAGDTWKLNSDRASSFINKQQQKSASARSWQVGKEEDHNNGGYLAGSIVPLVHSTRLQNIACGKITRDETLSNEREVLHFYRANVGWCTYVARDNEDFHL